MGGRQGREGCTVFVLKLATGLLGIRHDSIDGKDRLSHKRRRRKKDSNMELIVQLQMEKKKKSAKEQRRERERVWIDPTQAYIVNNSA